ncbi:hypothetical protein PV327_008170 [Microctonus hyperodae]|uniref:Cytochrome c oxidase polypeptide VIII n=1 Tax=Microctonus hyperodae TaxID=165561 RepID=A0AA39KGP9_MICHY|nr:hypothetical protein PV327_008170 [Microctonus hyperodae]
MIITGVKVANRIVASTNSQFVRYSSPMGTPPRLRIPFAEKVTHGVIMVAGILAVPTYIAVNIKNYRGDDE